MLSDLYVRKDFNAKPRGCMPRMFVFAAVAVLVISALVVLIMSRGCSNEKPQQENPGKTEAPVTVVAPPVSNPVTAPPVKTGSSTAQTIQHVPAPQPIHYEDPAPRETAINRTTYDARMVAAQRSFKQGNTATARKIAYEALDAAGNNRNLALPVRQLLSQINSQLLLTPSPMTEKVSYTIKSGDTLGELSKKYGTTIELIQKSNNINGSVIRIGDRLRILSKPFSMVVDVSDKELLLSLDGRFFKSYRVGTGKYAKTPTGKFKIVDRIQKPTWWRPDGKAIPFGDPENVLGTHWLALNVRGFGIHGTWEPDTIGFAESAGCVRMLNSDIEELYTIIPIGTQVEIRP